MAFLRGCGKNKKYKSRKLIYIIGASSLVLGTLAFTGTTVTHAFSPITDSKNMRYVGAEPSTMPNNLLDSNTNTNIEHSNKDTHIEKKKTDTFVPSSQVNRYIEKEKGNNDPDYNKDYNTTKQYLNNQGVNVVPDNNLDKEDRDHINKSNKLNKDSNTFHNFYHYKKEQVPNTKSTTTHTTHNPLVDTYTKTVHDGKGHSTTSTTTHYKKQGDTHIRKEDIHNGDIHTSQKYVVDDNSHQYTGKHKNVYQYNRYYMMHKNHLEIIKEREHQHELDIRKYEATKKLHEINLQKLNQVKIEHENNLKKLQEQEKFHQDNLSKIETQEKFHEDNLNKIKAQEMQHELNVQKWNVAHGVEASQNG